MFLFSSQLGGPWREMGTCSSEGFHLVWKTSLQRLHRTLRRVQMTSSWHLPNLVQTFCCGAYNVIKTSRWRHLDVPTYHKRPSDVQRTSIRRLTSFFGLESVTLFQSSKRLHDVCQRRPCFLSWTSSKRLPDVFDVFQIFRLFIWTSCTPHADVLLWLFLRPYDVIWTSILSKDILLTSKQRPKDLGRPFLVCKV